MKDEDWEPPEGYQERRAEILAEEADDERDGGIAIVRPPFNPTLAQIEVLIAVIEHGSNKAVAHALGLSQQTIKNYMAHILWRLQAKSRTHAILIMWPVLKDAFPPLPDVSPSRNPKLRTGWVRRKADRFVSKTSPASCRSPRTR